MIKKRQLLVFALFVIVLIYLLNLTFTDYNRPLANSLGLQNRGFVTNTGETIYNLDQKPRGIDEDRIVYKANEIAFFAYISVILLISLGLFYILGKDVNIGFSKEKELFEDIDKYGKINSLAFLVIFNLFLIYDSGGLSNFLNSFSDNLNLTVYTIFTLPTIIVFLVYKKNKYFIISIIVGLVYSTLWLFISLDQISRTSDYILILSTLTLFIISLVLIILPIFWYRKRSSMQKSN